MLRGNYSLVASHVAKMSDLRRQSRPVNFCHRDARFVLRCDSGDAWKVCIFKLFTVQ
jgi:hypothetical protein